MAKQGPEAKLIAKCRATARKKYGTRLVDIKYHGDIYAEAGVSDLLHVLDSVFCAVEMKAPESYPVRGMPSVEKYPGPNPFTRGFISSLSFL